jgi:hypothetical protein
MIPGLLVAPFEAQISWRGQAKKLAREETHNGSSAGKFQPQWQWNRGYLWHPQKQSIYFEHCRRQFHSEAMDSETYPMGAAHAGIAAAAAAAAAAPLAPPVPSSALSTPSGAFGGLFREDSIVTAQFWKEQSKVVPEEVLATKGKSDDEPSAPKGVEVKSPSISVAGLLESEQFSDCTIIQGEHRFRAHRYDRPVSLLLSDSDSPFSSSQICDWLKVDLLCSRVGEAD